MSMDLVNGLLEIGGALITLLSVRQVLRDRMVRGVHWGPTIFFTGWGIWNLFYYPALDQPISTVGAAALVLVNAIYLALLLRFRDRPSVVVMHFPPLSEQATREIREHFRPKERHRDCDHTMSGSSPSGDKVCVRCGDVFDHMGDFVRATR